MLWIIYQFPRQLKNGEYQRDEYKNFVKKIEYWELSELAVYG